MLTDLIKTPKPLAVLLTGVFMGLLDTTIVNIALPTIRANLKSTSATYP